MTNSSGTAVGFTATSPTPVSDNLTSFSMLFGTGSGGFQGGETFTFSIDVDGSGAIVDASDMLNLMTLAITFGQSAGPDVVLSGIVNFTESLNRQGSGYTDYGRATITGDVDAPVPEPVTFALLGAGLLALGLLRRKRA